MKKMYGGDASNWVLSNFGNGQAQWDNTFSNGGPANVGNLLPTVSGAPAVLSYNVPQGSNYAHVPKGGRSRGGRKGGNLGQMVGTAAVPIGLWALQNKYTRRGFKVRKSQRSKSRRSRRSRRYRRY
jgi:hypothetical protein